MDIISPELIWIEGICYRINNCHEVPKHEEYFKDLDENFSDDDLEDDLKYTTCTNGRTRTTLHVSQSFFGYVIGTKGTTRKRIENETKTDIKIPPRGQNGDIIITGSDIKGVSAAARRIQMIVSAARMKQPPTHFLSIPVNSESIKQSFNKFKDEVLNDSQGIKESLFIEPEKLHITLLMMHLADNEERLMAKHLLEDAKTKIIDSLVNGVNLNIKVKGVGYMNDDPKAVNVLYAEVEEVDTTNHGIITKITNELNKFYSKSGFLIKNYDSVKLHITLMKSRFESNEDGIETKRVPFDASNILKKYSQFEFGEQNVKNIHLSQIETSAADGYYQSTAVIPI